ncbi:ligand-dependent nuclear receptor corepressor-like protein isoform X2 [Microcaecilia unicolor]|nr:ligand-dependent nuclear receptor corepressor-like protein isoform X2 [Microcaecilia unicolor]
MLQSDENSKLDERTAVLYKVLDSLCPYHRQQILNMLIFLTHELNICTSYVSLESQKSLHEDKGGLLCSSVEHRHTRRCRLQCLKPSPLLPVKKVHCLSCQTVSLCSVQPMVNKEVCKNPNLNMHHGKTSQNEIRMNDSGRPRSPSPPPLSPEWTDNIEHLKLMSDYGDFESNKFELNNQPPSLSPVACSNRGLKICKKGRSGNLIGFSLSTDQNNKSVNSKNFVKSESASVFQDLMDRINEKLKSIETLDIETNSGKFTSIENRKANSSKFGEFIKSLVQNAKANDYSFMELLSQHEKSVENKTIQTRFRKRQETLLAMHISPDSSFMRRQSLQIKRQLVCLDDPYVRKKLTCKGNRTKYINSDESTPQKSSNKTRGNMSESITMQDVNNQEKSVHRVACQTQLLELPQQSFKPHFDMVTCNRVVPNYLNLTTAGGETIGNKQDNTQNCLDSAKQGENESAFSVDYSEILGRTKHNVTPGWYSVCITNDFMFKKSATAKLSSGSLEESKIVEGNVERSGNIDVSKIARNTSLQVVVERLEDALRLPKKASLEHALMQRFKINSKLKNVLKSNIKQNTNKELCHGTNSLLKSHVPHSNVDKIEGVSSNLFDVTEPEYDCPINPSDWNSNNLVPISKERKRESETVGHSPFSYYSPIKLMFVSEINCKEGVRYTLSSISVASKGNSSDCFFEKSSESLINKTEKIENLKESSQDVCNDVCLDISNENISAEKEPNLNNILDTYSMNETEKYCIQNLEKTVDRLSNMDDSTPKRKPGRPKKIGPQVLKQTKRPIGRPPKAKINGNKSIHSRDESSNDKSAEFASSGLEEYSKNNLTITVVFGRSRRIQRHVSEDMWIAKPVNNVHVLNVCADLKNNGNKILDELNTVANHEFLKSSYEYVRPIKDKPVLHFSGSNIIHPSKKPGRKPGRPAKIKISGISVTVNSVSPQGRKVSMNSCLKPFTQESTLEKTISKHDFQQCSNLSTMQDNCSQDRLDFPSMGTKMDAAHLRYSVRKRESSLPFSHSLESVNMFACKPALLHKSYKLCLNKAKDQKDNTKQVTMSTPLKHILDARNAKKDCEERCNSIFEVSSDPIFPSDTSLRWWANTVSNDSLLEDLDSRFEKIANTWLQVDGHEPKCYLYGKGSNDEPDCKLEISNPLRTCLLEFKISPVKMLFQKKCDMNELCSWFMETTETKSLSMVRKANARNPLDVISSRSKAKAKHSDLNLSPFSKHLKKFALSSSQSSEKLQMLHGVVRPQCFNLKSTLVGIRTKFIRLKQEKLRLQHKLCNQLVERTSQHSNVNYKYGHVLKKVNDIVPRFQEHSTSETEQPMLSAETEIMGVFQLSALRTHASKLIEENEINSKWKLQKTQDQSKIFCQSTCNPETFKDCRVCLKKINHVGKKSSWNLNTALPAPESSEFGNNCQAYNERSCALRSHSARENVFKGGKEIRTDNGAESHHNETVNNRKHKSSTKWLDEQMKKNKSSMFIKSEHSSTSVSKVLNKKNGKKRPGVPLEIDMKVAKRPKRQTGSEQHMTSYYSKFQLAHRN